MTPTCVVCPGAYEVVRDGERRRHEEAERVHAVLLQACRNMGRRGWGGGVHRGPRQQRESQEVTARNPRMVNG